MTMKSLNNNDYLLTMLASVGISSGVRRLPKTEGKYMKANKAVEDAPLKKKKTASRVRVAVKHLKDAVRESKDRSDPAVKAKIRKVNRKSLSSRIVSEALESFGGINVSALAEHIEMTGPGLYYNVHNDNRWFVDSWLKLLVSIGKAKVEGDSLVIKSKFVSELRRMAVEPQFFEGRSEIK